VAGNVAALARVIDACKSAGAKRAMQLAVSAPFHCALMQPAADQMAEILANITFEEPQIRIIQNVNADYPADVDEIRANLISQMSSAVLWSGTIRKILAGDVSHIIECGPGKVLSGLNRRIDKSIESENISSLESLAAVVEGFQ